MNDWMSVLRIALTGGIASGKTTVSDAFASRGVAIIDTDIIARELVAPGQPALTEIHRHFGAEYLTAEGELDRPKLRRLIFANEQAREDLQALLHPLIRDEVQHQISQLKQGYCLIVIPLLAETGRDRHKPHRVLLVDSSEQNQLQRVMARDHVDETQAKRILSAQATRQQRLAIADDVIDNSADQKHLDAEVERLHRFYNQLAAQQ